jgi:hypothetical protein
LKKRLALWMFGLYRPSTRRQYRADFEALIDDLSASGKVRWGLFDIAIAGCRDRLAGRRPAGVVVMVGTLLVVAAFGLTAWDGPPGHRATTGTTSIASTSLPIHPTRLPIAPPAGAGSCPNPPALPYQLPPGAVISAPGLLPPATGGLTLLDGTTYDWTGRCEYTITFPP